MDRLEQTASRSPDPPWTCLPGCCARHHGGGTTRSDPLGECRVIRRLGTVPFHAPGWALSVTAYHHTAYGQRQPPHVVLTVEAPPGADAAAEPYFRPADTIDLDLTPQQATQLGELLHRAGRDDLPDTAPRGTPHGSAPR